MLSEMTTYMKSANTPGTAIEASVLLAMYSNDGYTWEDSEELDMNGSTKQLKNKTVGGETTYTEMFESFMEGIAAASATTEADVFGGTLDTAGVVQSTTNENKKYLQDAQGQEWTNSSKKV